MPCLCQLVAVVALPERNTDVLKNSQAGWHLLAKPVRMVIVALPERTRCA
jgi:hypothetical protein